jgi:Predicted 3'-5' exonuclease related to the exonuclease domain of PolB
VDTRKYYTREVIDTLQLWTHWGNKKGATLDAVATALGCGAKTGSGSNVARWWAERNLERIKSYCQQDVRLTYRIYCRLTYQEPKQFSSETESVSIVPAGTDITYAAEEDVCRA